jgi:hypothetical protein
MVEQRLLEVAVSNERQDPLRPVPQNARSDRSTPSWLRDVTVEHGPPDVLGRFFLKADAAARERGVTLEFAPLHELQRVNDRNRATWKPLVPLFSTRYNDLDPEHSFCILGRNRAGDVVATQAARLFEWPDSSFYDAARSLRLFYDHPEKYALPGETCTVTAEATKFVTGRVVFSGGGWYRPDYRKRWLSGILPRISRAYAYTRWNAKFTTTVMDKGVVNGGFHKRCGYSNIEWALDWRNTPLGDMYLAFLWMQPAELISDLRNFLATFDAQVDAVVDDRRAQNG